MPPSSASVALTACGSETSIAYSVAWRRAISSYGPTCSADSPPALCHEATRSSGWPATLMSIRLSRSRSSVDGSATSCGCWQLWVMGSRMRPATCSSWPLRYTSALEHTRSMNRPSSAPLPCRPGASKAARYQMGPRWRGRVSAQSSGRLTGQLGVAMGKTRLSPSALKAWVRVIGFRPPPAAGASGTARAAAASHRLATSANSRTQASRRPADDFMTQRRTWRMERGLCRSHPPNQGRPPDATM